MKKLIKYLGRLLMVISILNFFNACNEEETVFVFDEVSAPTDLSIDLETEGDFDETVTLTPTAQNVSQFEIYFGETEDETPVTVLAGESVTYTFENFGQYTIRVIAVGPTGLTSEFIALIEAGEEIVIIEEPTETLNLPVDHESETLTYDWVGFGNINAAVVANPDASGNNTSATVLEVNKPTNAETWAGATLSLDSVIDFSETSNFSVNVWSPRANVPVLFKIENADASLFAEVQTTTTMAGAWETLIFDMATSTNGVFDLNNEYVAVIVFPDFGNVGTDETFYFDDIQLTTETNTGGGNTDEALILPVNLESSALSYEWGGFGNATPSVITNPDASGNNTSATVLQIEKGAGAEVWAGSSLQLDEAIDFSSLTSVSINVWSPRAGTPILFKVEDTNSEPDANGNPSVVAEVQAISTLENSWETLTFDMSTFAAFDASNSYDRIVIFPDFGNVGNGELFYFDDIMLAESTVTITCQSEMSSNIDVANGDINWTFMNGENAFEAFGGIVAPVVTNPYPDNVNSSCYVQKFEKANGCETWGGVGIELPTAIDYSTLTKKQFTMKVYAESQITDVTLRLEYLPYPDTEPSVDIVQTITTTGQWEELTFDFSGNDDKTFKSMIIYFERNETCDGDVYYFDDIIMAN